MEKLPEGDMVGINPSTTNIVRVSQPQLYDRPALPEGRDTIYARGGDPKQLGVQEFSIDPIEKTSPDGSKQYVITMRATDYRTIVAEQDKSNSNRYYLREGTRGKDQLATRYVLSEDGASLTVRQVLRSASLDGNVVVASAQGHKPKTRFVADTAKPSEVIKRVGGTQTVWIKTGDNTTVEAVPFTNTNEIRETLKQVDQQGRNAAGVTGGLAGIMGAAGKYGPWRDLWIATSTIDMAAHTAGIINGISDQIAKDGIYRNAQRNRGTEPEFIRIETVKASKDDPENKRVAVLASDDIIEIANAKDGQWPSKNAK
jgi:hypothetical protein